VRLSAFCPWFVVRVKPLYQRTTDNSDRRERTTDTRSVPSRRTKAQRFNRIGVDADLPERSLLAPGRPPLPQLRLHGAPAAPRRGRRGGGPLAQARPVAGPRRGF